MIHPLHYATLVDINEEAYSRGVIELSLNIDSLINLPRTIQVAPPMKQIDFIAINMVYFIIGYHAFGIPVAIVHSHIETKEKLHNEICGLLKISPLSSKFKMHKDAESIQKRSDLITIIDYNNCYKIEKNTNAIVEYFSSPQKQAFVKVVVKDGGDFLVHEYKKTSESEYDENILVLMGNK
ncbi:hypothetical protein GEMRC1_000175 [Eukaryota sp. GEM-RC1]